jgi:CheY-like chemotaxis protein
MKFSLPWACVFAAVFCLVVQAGSAQENLEEQKALQQAVESLGNPSFSARKRAVSEIQQAGMKAEDLLIENLRHPSLEVRLKVAELLSEIRRNDIQRRIDDLLAFRADGKELELPGWEKYVEIVGDNKVNRELFAEMLRDEYSMMQMAEQDAGSDLSAKLNEAARNQNANNQPTTNLGTYAAYLFLACLEENTESNLISYIYTASHRQPVNVELKQGTYLTPLHKMLEVFLEDVDPRYVTLVLNLAVEFNLKSGTKFATDFLETANQSDYQTRVAIMCLAKFGDESHLPVLEKLFSDQRTFRIFLNGKQRDSEVRDYALVACLFITEQPLQTYNLQTYPDIDRENINGSLNAGFTKDEDREPAFEKWAEYRKLNPAEEDETATNDADAKTPAPSR